MADKYTAVEARLDDVLAQSNPDKGELKNVLNDMMRIYTGDPNYDLDKKALN